MTVNYTSLLSLGQPVTGTESGTWGDDVNNAVTAYLDIAVAGTLSITGDGAVTLANTQGTSSATNIGPTTAQYHALRIVGPLSATKVITAPSTNKSYVVINTDSTYGVTIKASGQTGVTVPANSRALVTYNGTDYVLVSGSNISSLSGLGTGVATALGVNVGSAGAVVVNGGALGTPSSGNLSSCTNLSLTTGVTGLLPIANGGTGANNASTARSNLGATTVGANFFTLSNPSAITFPRINADNTVSALSASDFRTATGAGTVTSVGGTGSVNGITLTGTVTSSGNLTLGGTLSNVSLTSQVTGTLPLANGGTGQTTAQAAINSLAGATTSGQYLRGNGSNVVMSAIQAGDVPTLNQNTTGTAANVTGIVAVANGGTGANNASTARTNLGSTTVGSNFFTLTNPSAITFPRINADNTVSALTDSQFRTAIGAGTGNGSVTSVATGTGLTGGPITGSGTISLANTTVAASSYGSASQVATFTVDAQGRLTAAGNTSIAISGSAVSGNISGNAANVTGTVTVANGGTGLTATPTNGQIDIGNGSGFTRTTLTAGSGVSISNGAGSITISATGSGGSVTSVAVSGGTTGLTTSGGPITTSGTITLGGTLAVANGGTGATDAATARSNLGAGTGDGTVTSVGGTGTVNGITLSGTVTSTGNLTLGGTLTGVNLGSQVTGTLPVANGGTGATTFSSGYVLKGNGTSAVSSSVMYDDGTSVGVGISSLSSTYKLWVKDGAYIGTTGVTGTATLYFYGGSTYNNTIFNDGAGNFIISGQLPSSSSTLISRFAVHSWNDNAFPSSNELLRLTTSALKVSATQVTAPDGSASAPSYSFSSSGNSDNGMYLAAANQLAFSTSGGEKVRIDASGNVMIATTTVDQSATLTVNGYISSLGITERAGTSGASGGNRFNLDWTGTTADLWVDTTNLGAITVSSDYRIKKNIVTQTESGLAKVAQLRPVKYERTNYKNLFEEDGIVREGFIAHELAAIIPSAVDGDKDDENKIQSLRLDALCSVLVKAVQELAAKVTSLESKLN